MATKTMPDLATEFAQSVQSTLQIVAATETLWLTAPPAGAIRQQLKAPQLEAIYESAFLRVFGHWEAFLEEVVVRWMANYESPSYKPAAATGTNLYQTISSARIGLYTNGTHVRDYLLWHNPGIVCGRVNGRLAACPVYTTVTANATTLGHLAAVRHHIAHGSSNTRSSFKAASLALTGNDHGGNPGKSLRALDVSDPLNTPKWIHVWSKLLTTWANQIYG